ncbi:HET-domain-containing protein [Phaeosphaeriaceae sp. SRC1lsM3a]|nr:HET-domain-containing protein [Stagonospora sp. SRC1lsM3a]
MIKSWIQDCNDKHVQNQPETEALRAIPQQSITHCSSSKSYNPTRLLHVDMIDSGWKISLVDSKVSLHDYVHYSALSYCWGGAQLYKSTRESITTQQGLIEYQQLPATIQDACRVTYGLGYSYLWVDALCIVQDDEAEMQREIANMKHIYSNAVVTIAASRANSSAEGFLQTREPVPIFPLTLRAVGAYGTASEVGLMGSFNRDFQPLDSRAWALQENLLSSRVLEFTSAVTRFYCATSCMQKENSVRYKTDGLLSRRGGYSTWQIGHIFPTQFADLDSANRYWWDIVRFYTHRKLSVPADRPLAISGLAERLYAQTVRLADSGQHSTYIAGLWSADLSEGLDWFVDSLAQPRPEEYQGPSWSWLSVSGGIMRPYMLAANRGQVAIEICDYEMSLKSQYAHFGAVTNATLTVRCYISVVMFKDERAYNELAEEVTMENLNWKPRLYVSREQDTTIDRRKDWQQTATRFDTSEDDGQDWNSKNAFLMQLRNDTQDRERLDTLILQYDSTVDGIRRFRRVGFCRVEGRDTKSRALDNGRVAMSTWSQGWDREVIQLI